MQSKKRIGYIIFGIFISVFMLWFLFKDIDFAKLMEALKGANYLWLIPNILLIIITMYIRAYRWQLMINPIKRVPFHKLLAATCVGFMANNVLPLRLGEFVRAFSLSKQENKITKSAALATIFIERTFFDLAALLMIFGGVFAFSTVVQEYVDDAFIKAVYLSIAIALIGLLSMLLMGRNPEKTASLITEKLGFIPEKAREKIKSIVLKFSGGLQFLSSFKTVLFVEFYTLLIWLIMGFSNVFIFYTFGFEIPVSAAFFLLVFVSIAILIPSSPGFVGIYHAAASSSVMAYGIGKEEALSFALVLHATQYIVVTLMGFYFLRKEHFSLKSLEEEASSEV